MGDADSVRAFLRFRPLFFAIAADAHAERWANAGVSARAARGLIDCPRSRRTLSEHPEGLFPGAVAADWTEFDPESLPGNADWALLDGDIIWRSGLRFGASCFRDGVARLILKDDVARFKAVAGDDARAFALRQAPLLWKEAPSLPGLPEAGDVGERVVTAAGLGLGSWLAGLPESLSNRVVLKLPPRADRGIAEAAEWPDERRRLWLDAVARVFATEGL